jgi:hypothetical protein
LGQLAQSFQFLANVADPIEQLDNLMDWLKGLNIRPDAGPVGARP